MIPEEFAQTRPRAPRRPDAALVDPAIHAGEECRRLFRRQADAGCLSQRGADPTIGLHVPPTGAARREPSLEAGPLGRGKLSRGIGRQTFTLLPEYV